jgi:translocator protein
MVHTTISGHVFTLLACCALVLTAAAFGGLASAQSGAFYAQLVRPSWAPPAAVFGPVWTVLYIMIALAGWLAWTGRGPGTIWLPVSLFVLQLILNGLWTWLFFVWRQGLWSFVEIVALWLAIAATITVFWQIRPLAGMLLLPYLVWVTFAAALNYALWRLNPHLLS